MKVVVLENAEHETAGLIGDGLVVRRATVERRRLWKGEPAGTLDGVDALIALGGSMCAWDDGEFPYLADESRLLGEAARAGRPTLGICLGAQLLARGLGARVFRGPHPEMGILPIELTDAGRSDRLLGPLDGKDVLHWHADTFDLPEGAVHLARSSAYAHQAFRFGRNAWGVQFHPECDLPMRRTWARASEQLLRVAGVPPASLWAKSTQPLDERGRAFAAAFLRHL